MPRAPALYGPLLAAVAIAVQRSAHAMAKRHESYSPDDVVAAVMLLEPDTDAAAPLPSPLVLPPSPLPLLPTGVWA